MSGKRFWLALALSLPLLSPFSLAAQQDHPATVTLTWGEFQTIKSDLLTTKQQLIQVSAELGQAKEQLTKVSNDLTTTSQSLTLLKSDLAAKDKEIASLKAKGIFEDILAFILGGGAGYGTRAATVR